MEFRILGRLDVVDDGQQLALGGARQRALLVLLVLHRRHVVSIDRLVEDLWGECPPPSAAKTVQVYVSRLRKALGDGLLQTRGRGYVLALDRAQVDADRFETLVGDGRAALESGDAPRAAQLLGAGLALWRGPPLEEFVYEPFAQLDIARLQEARLTAIEDRIDELVAEHPLRERLVAALMLALYRGGRQTDALAAARAARERLVEKLGLEPGPEIGDLERRILQHDSTLAAPRRETRPPRARSHAAIRRVVAPALVIGALLTSALVLSAGASRRRASRSPARTASSR